MRPRLLLTTNCKFAVDFFARGLHHTRTAVARLPLRQLGFLVSKVMHCHIIQRTAVYRCYSVKFSMIENDFFCYFSVRQGLETVSK